MKATIPYGEEQIEVDFPEPCEILVPNKVKIKNEDETIENALRNPFDSMSFEEFASKSKKLDERQDRIRILILKFAMARWNYRWDEDSNNWVRTKN